MKNYEELNLSAIAGGKPTEQVNFQLGRAIENCLDPNTDATGVRKVVLTLTLKPNADRSTAEISYKVDAKLQGDAPGIDVVLMSRQGKRGWLSCAQQMDIDDMLTQSDDESLVVDSDGVVVGIKKGGAEC